MGITICIVFRKDKLNQNLAPVHLRFTQNRKIRYKSTGISLPIEAWNTEHKSIDSNYPNAVKIQHTINTMLLKYQKRVAKLEALDMEVTIEAVLETKSPLKRYTLGDCFDRYIERLTTAQQFSTASKYRYTLMSLRKFKSTNVTLDSVTPVFLNEFELHMLNSTCKCN